MFSNFRIGNISIGLQLYEDLDLHIKSLLAPCIKPDANSEYMLNIKKVKTIEWNGSYNNRNDYFYIQENGMVFTIGNDQFMLRVSLDEKRASASIAESGPYTDRAIAWACIKWYLSFLIIENGGVPLHSSSVFRNGKSLLFIGRSGTGKSTISRLLSERWQKGSDEYNAVFSDNAGILRICTTPFTSSSGGGFFPEENSLNGVFFLEKADHNKIEVIKSNAEKYFYILENIYTKPANAFLGAKILENIARIPDCVPCNKLYFINDQTIASFFEKSYGET
jgi:hypothetical protein